VPSAPQKTSFLIVVSSDFSKRIERIGYLHAQTAAEADKCSKNKVKMAENFPLPEE